MIFLSDKNALFSSPNLGSDWSRAANLPPATPQEQPYSGPPLPIAANSQGELQWGATHFSGNQGLSWTHRSIHEGANGGEAYAIGLMPMGRVVASSAGADDVIRVTADSGLTWRRKKELEYYYPILQFEQADSNLIFAAGAQLWVSGNSGETWRNWRPERDGAPSVGRFPYKISLQKNQAYGNLPTPWTLWALQDSGYWTGTVMLHSPVLLRYFSSGLQDSRKIKLPDSALTSFRVQNDGTIWVGTWGKGVFSSRDLGVTWDDRNQGLADRHVETLYQSPEGVFFAIAGSGVYRLDPNPVALFRPAGTHGNASQSAAMTLSTRTLFHFQSNGLEYLSNGRQAQPGN
ncbi:MAG: hypothetical protein ABIW76_08415 [Fibrobacteria bacterium]